jgi:hypothetical protein
MENDDFASRAQILEWLEDHRDLVAEMAEPYRKQRAEAISNCAPIFFDEIQSQYREKVLSVVGVEVCKQLGCSVELYYDVVGDDYEWTS